LDINPYNDQIKMQLCRLAVRHPLVWTDEQLGRLFEFLSPTFLRLQPDIAADAIATLIRHGRALPAAWLTRTPYDSIIRLAQALARSPENQPLLMDLVALYRRAHPEGGTERKLELLMVKLSSFQSGQKSA